MRRLIVNFASHFVRTQKFQKDFNYCLILPVLYSIYIHSTEEISHISLLEVTENRFPKFSLYAKVRNLRQTVT